MSGPTLEPDKLADLPNPDSARSSTTENTDTVDTAEEPAPVSFRDLSGVPPRSPDPVRMRLR